MASRDRLAHLRHRLEVGELGDVGEDFAGARAGEARLQGVGALEGEVGHQDVGGGAAVAGGKAAHHLHRLEPRRRESRFDQRDVIAVVVGVVEARAVAAGIEDAEDDHGNLASVMMVVHVTRTRLSR